MWAWHNRFAHNRLHVPIWMSSRELQYYSREPISLSICHFDKQYENMDGNIIAQITSTLKEWLHFQNGQQLWRPMIYFSPKVYYYPKMVMQCSNTRTFMIILDSLSPMGPSLTVSSMPPIATELLISSLHWKSWDTFRDLLVLKIAHVKLYSIVKHQHKKCFMTFCINV